MGVKVKFANAHNVFKTALEGEERFERNDPSKLYVNPHTQLLIDKLLLRNPAWEFWASDFASAATPDKYIHSRFEVMSDGERLGWFGSDKNWRSNEPRYEFDCDRLKTKRQKSTTPHTKDLNKAAKTILGSMYNRTPAERARTAMSAVSTAVGRSLYQAESRYRVTLDTLAPYMVEFVAARWEEFCAVTLPKPADAARAVLLDRKQAAADVNTINAPLAANKGTVLTDAGAAYVVSRMGNPDEARIVRLDEMSDKLKGSLGILKLLEPKQFATGIGMRVDPTTYYVVDVDEQQQP